MKKNITVMATAVAFVASMACARAGDLVIGELHPITGPASFYGLPMSQALKLAAEQLSEAGGVDVGGVKYTVRIEIGDDQAAATTGVAALRKLLAGGVRYVIGPLASAVAPAIKPIIDSNPGMTQIIDGSIADGVVNGRNSFRVQASADVYNNAVRDFVKLRGYSNVALMSDRAHPGFMTSEPRMVAALNEQGTPVLGQEYFKIGDTDFSAQLTKLKALNPAALVIRGYPGEGALITKQAHQLGYVGQIVWEMGAAPATVMKNIPAAEMNGVVNCIPRMTQDYIRLKVPNALKLEVEFKKKYNAEPGENAAFSYDALLVLITAMRKAGSIDPVAVNKALAALKVSDVPDLVIQYKPFADGLLFQDGQAAPPSVAQVWEGESWQDLH
jgi:branched-chain amino acid transport system substrate-binding protein